MFKESGELSVRTVTRLQYLPFLIDIHYAKRSPSVSYAFGLFEGEHLEGVVCYGTPPSSTLRAGVCGVEYKDRVLELNRLCLISNKKNHASYLVSKSLKMLPKGKIVVSFADSSQGHVGYVYQATNFLYCGLSAKRTDWKVRGLEHLHGITIADRFRGQPNRSKLMRDYYGDDFYLKERPRKHRYVTFVGSKGFKAQARKALKYPSKDYEEAKSYVGNVKGG